MTTSQIETSLKDAIEDLNVVLRLAKKGNKEEAKQLLAQCHEIRMAVWGGTRDVISLMEKFDATHNELFLQLYS